MCSREWTCASCGAPELGPLVAALESAFEYFDNRADGDAHLAEKCRRALALAGVSV